jgi:hypothetical protein
MENKKMTDYEIMSAIATAVHQSSNFLDSKKHNDYQEGAEKAYWICWDEPVSGLKCRFKDNKLILSFTVETHNTLKLDNHYENKINTQLEDIVSGIKKKYKDITSKTLSLTKDSDVFEQVTDLSFKRKIRTYTCLYTIGGIKSFKDQYEKDVREMLKAAIDKADEMTKFRSKK